MQVCCASPDGSCLKPRFKQRCDEHTLAEAKQDHIGPSSRSRAGYGYGEEPNLLRARREDDMCPAILRPGIIIVTLIERLLLAVTDRGHVLRIDSERGQILLRL